MNCQDAEELIQQTLDAPLSSSVKARLETHLVDCSACRQAQRQYRRLTLTAADWAQRPALSETSPNEFSAQVMARLAAPPAPRPVWPGLLAVGLALSLMVALSTLVAPLLLTFAVWHPALPPPSPDSWLRVCVDGLCAVPQEAISLWTAANDSLMAAHWAALLLAAALPLNALLCLRARRDARRAA